MNLKCFLAFQLLLTLCALLLSGCDILTPNELEVTTEYIDEEEYSVVFDYPPLNGTFEKDSPPFAFHWVQIEGVPDYWVIEIDYMHDGTYMSRTVRGSVTYLMTEEEWNTIKENAPIEKGMQKINWRMRIDYKNDPFCEPYYTSWLYFWIKAE